MGVQVDRGVLVDDSLRTSIPGVWAVGECAEHRGQLVGLVAPAQAMARAAAADIAGTPAAYLPGPVATRLKVAGIDLFCMGELRRLGRGRRARHARRPLPARGLPRRRAGRLDRARRPAGHGAPDARPAGLRLQRRHAPRDPRLRRHRPRGRAPADARLDRLRLLPERGAGATGRGGRGRVPGRTGRRRESDRSARAPARGSPPSRSSVGPRSRAAAYSARVCSSRVRGVEDLDAVEAGEVVELRVRDVPVRVRPDREPAGGVDDVDRLRDGGAGAAHVGRRAGGRGRRRRARRASCPGWRVLELVREVRAARGRVVGGLDVQALGHLVDAADAVGAEVLERVQQRAVGVVDRRSRGCAGPRRQRGLTKAPPRASGRCS